MRIAINTRFLLKGKMEGFGWFTYETVKRIVEAHPEHEFFFFFDRSFDEKFIFAKNVVPIVLNPPARHPILFKIWFNYSVTRALKKYKIDLFFSPDGYLSLRTKIKQIAVIHDLNFEHYPEDIPASPRKYLKTYFPLFAKKAAHIITVSEFSKQDIVTTYNIDPNKITVAYNGASPSFKPIKSEEAQKVREKFTCNTEFFIYVGAIHPRKNVDRLLQAFDQFKTETGSETSLLIVGERLWKENESTSLNSTLKHTSSIFYSGHVDLAKLTALTASAKALVLVSYFEGFGIPIVEAFQSGTPVICGNLTSLPEIAGEAAIQVDPFSIDSISNGLKLLDSNLELQNELRQKGLIRCNEFSWDNSAEICWNVIKSALDIKE